MIKSITFSICFNLVNIKLKSSYYYLDKMVLTIRFIF